MESVVKRCRGDEAEEEWRRKRQVSAEEVRSEVTDDNGGGEVTSSSRIVLEIPEHVATSGIRKITLKLKKRNDQRSNVVDVPLTSVKKLFATGILDGARVKYVSPCQQNVLDAVITGGGYLCGCSSCNFSRVVNAHEFERHAGVTTRHPNNHIYLENGKPVYSFLRHLKTAPFPVIADFLNRRRREQEEEDEEEDNHTSRLIAAPKQHYKKTAEPSTRRRDNDLHRLLFMPNGLPDGAELAYFVKGQRMLGGYKHGNGILCNCCNKEISPSQFEAHAGMAARRQPYRHIYTSNGLTLHDIAISLSAGQKLTMGDSDDMCAVCGDGGDLILCRGCPRAFHAACLDLPSVPQHEWHCPNCKDKFDHGKRTAGGESSGTPRPIVIKLTRVVKAPEMDIGGCVVCRGHDFSAAKFDERTVMLCDQCEKEYHVGCLRESGLCDLKEIPKDQWFCCDDCNRIYNALQNSVSIGPDVVPASLSDMIFKKYTDKGLSLNAVADDIQWRILSGKSRNSEHLPLLSRSAAIFRECFDPIVAKSGRDLIPVMVYGRNISGQEFGGMYCVVLIVRSIVVSAGLVRIFGREVAELPLVATSREHQGKGYFQALFWCIERLLSSLKVENIVLPAAEEAESIWTNKFGFTKMSEERVAKYMREVQFTIFKGTSMLEKVVQSCEVQN